MRRRHVGSGPQRRKRLRMSTMAGGVVVTVKNRKIIPSNWDESLVRHYRELCLHPSQNLGALGGGSSKRELPAIMPVEHELHASAFVPGMVVFWFDRSRPDAMNLQQDVRYGRLDKAVERLDVRMWGDIKATYERRRGQAHIRTTIKVDHASRLDPSNLAGIPGVVVTHVLSYTFRSGLYSYQGLRTICPKDGDCGCREAFKRHSTKATENLIVSAAWRVAI